MPAQRTVDRKLSRKSDQRQILIRTLVTQLIENGQLTTTAPKAKAVKHYAEKLISSAVKGGLARRRKAIAKLDTVYAVNRLFDLIAPQMKRTSGFLTSSPAVERQGDNSPMVALKFVDEVSDELPKKSDKAYAPKKDSTKKTAKTKESK